MPGFNQSPEPRYAIIVFEGARCTTLHREDDPIRAREIFEYAVVDESKVDRRVEFYDRLYLIEAWSSEDE